MAKVISAKDVRKQYIVGSNVINALDGVDFEIEEGEFAVILGPSGAGKTTLLNVIGGMDNVTSGELLVDGTKREGGILAFSPCGVSEDGSYHGLTGG